MKFLDEKVAISKTKEDGITIFHINGIENNIRIYKYTLQRLLNEIESNKFKFLATGQPLPVIRRLYHSTEIH